MSMHGLSALPCFHIYLCAAVRLQLECCEGKKAPAQLRRRVGCVAGCWAGGCVAVVCWRQHGAPCAGVPVPQRLAGLPLPLVNVRVLGGQEGGRGFRGVQGQCICMTAHARALGTRLNICLTSEGFG